MRLAEKFLSINGEGRFAGTPAAFLRFTGCNLRCRWCDTRWANEPDCPYEECSPEALRDWVRNAALPCVTVTGGEPLLQPEMPNLLTLLGELPGIRVEVETNGAVSLAPFRDIPGVTFTMDWKLPGSGMEGKMCGENLSLLTAEDTLKFVCSSEADLLRAEELLRLHRPACPAFLSPVFGEIEPAAMVDFLLTHKLENTRIQIQMHKIVWDPNTRGV